VMNLICVPLNVSGGTASLYSINDTQGKNYFIGKEFSRAADEVDFYEAIRTLDDKCFDFLK